MPYMDDGKNDDAVSVFAHTKDAVYHATAIDELFRLRQYTVEGKLDAAR